MVVRSAPFLLESIFDKPWTLPKTVRTSRLLLGFASSYPPLTETTVWYIVEHFSSHHTKVGTGAEDLITAKILPNQAVFVQRPTGQRPWCAPIAIPASRTGKLLSFSRLVVGLSLG